MVIQAKAGVVTIGADALVTEFAPTNGFSDFPVLGFYFEGTAGNDWIYGTDLADAIDGLGGDDLLFGGGGNDLISGSAGNDYLSGAAGDDTLNGGAGDDRMSGGLGKDSFIGGSGRDTVTYADAAESIIVDITPGAEFPSQYAAAGDTYTSIENIVGTRFDDTIFGNDAGNWFYGGEGGDYLYGFKGDDRLSGENGADRLRGGAGFDILNGGAGDDNLNGEAGLDIMIGGAGRDTFEIFSEHAGYGEADVIGDFVKGEDKIAFYFTDGRLNRRQFEFRQGTEAPFAGRGAGGGYGPLSEQQFTLFWDTDDHQLYLVHESQRFSALLASVDGLAGNVTMTAELPNYGSGSLTLA